MTNQEIDERLKRLSKGIPEWAEHLRLRNTPKIEMELELLNMSMMAVFVMLGEIAKRLPECEERNQNGNRKTS